MYWSVDANVAIRGLQEPNRVFLLGAVVQYSLAQCSQLLYRVQLLRIMRTEWTFEICLCDNEHNRWCVSYLINKHTIGICTFANMKVLFNISGSLLFVGKLT